MSSVSVGDGHGGQPNRPLPSTATAVAGITLADCPYRTKPCVPDAVRVNHAHDAYMRRALLLSVPFDDPVPQAGPRFLDSRERP